MKHPIRICAFLILILLVACAPQTSSPTPPPATSAPTATEAIPTVQTPSATPTTTQAPEPTITADGLLAFYSERDGNAELYSMQANGSSQTRLTFNTYEDSSPAWSPDGSQIVYVSSQDDDRPESCFPQCLFQLYVIDADGGNPHRLVETDFPTHHPTWHPGGSQILFDDEFNFEGNLYLADVDTGAVTLLIEDAFWGDWSSDGAQIVFASQRDGNVELYLAAADGSSIQRLTDNDRLDAFPAWSPDGEKIAFMAGSTTARQIFVINTDGSNERQLTEEGRVNEDPAWSPDGQTIAFQSNRKGQYHIYIMAADGSGQTPLTTEGENYWAAWQPLSAVSSALQFEKSTQHFTSTQTYQVGVGDLDGDGDLDAVFANPMRNPAKVWLNDGSGALIDTGQQLTEYGHGVALADFDSDGDLDAFIVCHQFSTGSKLYLNDSSGQFTDSGLDLGDASISASSMNLIDLNNDGFPDVHISYYHPNGLADKVYLNDGSGALTDSGLALDEEHIAWGDLDGDGDLDYIGKQSGVGLIVQRNDGSGQFTPGWQMADAHTTIGSIALADFDADGDLDALVANGFRDTGSFPTRLLLNDGSGQFTDSGQTLNETISADLAVGDLDNDGDLDIFIANMDWQNEIWLNDGAGNLTDSGLLLGENSDASGQPTLADIDGDGDLDILCGNFKVGLVIWFNLSQ